MMPKKLCLGLMVAALLGWQWPAVAQVVPGAGQRIVELGDDFEDANWSFTLNLPKASSNIDKVGRGPMGFSANGMWFESAYRGTPDFVKRVETPPGGITGSTGALALQTLYSGIPGQLSNKFQQDDLIANVQQKMGFMIPASWTPSYVVRVYVPPFENWEKRIGSSFGFRADCQTMINKPTKVGKLFRTGGTSREIEQYWPGFFIQFNGKNHPQHTDKNTATILIRSGERGQDIPGPVILQEGWWTLGMTITPDGKVHYYGHEGVHDLTAKDHLYSNFPYGYTCLQTSTYFFNVVNQDDGRSWSTRWIIDDPKVYVATGSYTPRPPQVAAVPAQPVSQTKPVAAPATPVTTAPAVQATPAVSPPAVTTQPVPMPTTTPVAPVQAPATTTTAPALQATPQAVQPAPAQTPAPQATPGIPTSSLPKLNTQPVAVSAVAPASRKSEAQAVSTLPQLTQKPMAITPAKAAQVEAASPAPALLPEASLNAEPVLSVTAPAPAALPVDGPALEKQVAPSTPPAPAQPE